MPLRRYHHRTRQPACVALTVLPLALLYGIGVLWASPHARSGVDVVTGVLLANLGTDGYLAVQATLALVIIGVAIHQLRGDTIRSALMTGPIVGESTLYGLVMGMGILWLMEEQALLGPAAGPLAYTWFEDAVIAAGAGLHEEFVFRLLLLPALAVGLERGLAMPRALAWGAAAVLSSLAFAGAHHLAGEPFVAWAFTYRTFAGLLFAGVFITRGFAVAAWTHAIYDFHILIGSG